MDLGRTGRSRGDQDIFTAVQFNEEGTRRVGTSNGVCVLTNLRKNIEVCSEVFTLPHGTITIEGANEIGEEDGEEPEMERASAVTGGTGLFQNARGEASEEGGGHEEIVVIRLIP